jgi:hypothetical protein
MFNDKASIIRDVIIAAILPPLFYFCMMVISLNAEAACQQAKQADMSVRLERIENKLDRILERESK